MSEKHSPGPWRVSVDGIYVEDAEGNDIACMSDRAEYDVDARLIAAAPEMLALLRQLKQSGLIVTWRPLHDLLARLDGEAPPP